MAVGLFGGTFDPIHMGHLRIAEEVREDFDLDRIYFIPAWLQPLKRQKNGAAADDRLRMVRSAIGGNSRFRASAVEMNRGGVSYTIDTVKHFSLRYRDIYFLLGLDAFRDIGLWKGYEDLLRLVNFVVMGRPGCLDVGLPVAVADEVQVLDSRTWEHSSGKRIYLHDITQIGISSTQVRGLVKKGKSIKYLVPSSVERYINKKGLYRE
jgi:nicotinate-nucleotide adenylyltransferase